MSNKDKHVSLGGYYRQYKEQYPELLRPAEGCRPADEDPASEGAAMAQLAWAFFKAVGLAPHTPMTPREKALMSYSEETKRIIIRAIELDPALQETILKIAELAYADGADSADD